MCLVFYFLFRTPLHYYFGALYESNTIIQPDPSVSADIKWRVCERAHLLTYFPIESAAYPFDV